MTTRYFAAAALFLCLAPSLFAQGGPPLITDDTETVPTGKWEVNLAWLSEHSSGGWLHEVPTLDFNRGVSDRQHVNFGVPWIFVSDGTQRNGIGNGGIGSKWRFAEAKGGSPAVSIHPQVEFGVSVRSARLGLAGSGTSFAFPFEVQWEMSGTGMNADIGAVFEPGSPPGWTGGLAVGREVASMELLAEVHGEGVAATGESLWLFQVGLRRDFSESSTLLFAFGRSFASHKAEELRWTSYLALQLKF